MTTPRVLVTGATGRVGGQVLKQLLGAGVPARALVRNPERAALPPAPDVVRGDLSEPGDLGPALEGIDAVFLLVASQQVAEALPELLATIAEHAQRVVYLSAAGVTPSMAEDGGILGGHARAEHLVEESGLDWTFVRPGGFAANTLGWAEQIRAGDEVRWFHGAAVRSLVHEADTARVVVRALTEVGHIGRRHDFTGPERLDQTEQIRVIGNALGRDLRFVELDGDAAMRELFAGVPADLARSIIDGHAAMVHTPEEPTDVGELTSLLGRAPHGYRQWVADHLADFR